MNQPCPLSMLPAPGWLCLSWSFAMSSLCAQLDESTQFLHPFSWDGRETGGQLPAVALAHSSFSYIFQDSSFISFVEVGEWVLEDYWWLKENPFSTIANLTCFSQIFTPIYLKPMWGKCPFRFKWKVQNPENTTHTKRHIVWGCLKLDQLYIHLLDPWESKATHIRLLN